MVERITKTTLQDAAERAQHALLSLALAYETFGREDLKTDVLQVRKELIKATRFGGSWK